MQKIKYKKKLVKRAEHNAKEDIEFVGDLYVQEKGGSRFYYGNRESHLPEKKYLACAVGCMVLPEKDDERKAFFRLRDRHASYHEMLLDEFGIPGWLSEEAEDWFTDLEDECKDKGLSPEQQTKRLGDFVIAFAKALPESFDFETVKDGETGRESRKAFLEWLRRRDAKKAVAAA